MTRYVLVPGAGGAAWYWHRVLPLLEAAGHTAIAVELPADDDTAGLETYVELVLAAIAGDASAIVVGQSMGGITAAIVAARTELAGLVFVNAMIPLPGERVGAWGDAVGSSAARSAKAKRDGYSEEFDEEVYFLHDVPADVIADGEKHQRPQSEAVFRDHARFTAWPKIPIRSIAGEDDRLFPVELQQRMARERLGIEAEVVPGGHLAALSHPRELVAALLR